MKDRAYSIVIVDDHPIIHEGLKTLLSLEKNLKIKASATTVAEAEKLLKTIEVDLAIVDLSMGEADGTYRIQQICAKHPKLKVVVYTMSEEKMFAERVAIAGAKGYVMKTADSSILKQAIFTVLGGGLHFGPDIEARLQARKIGRSDGLRSLLDRLSNREIDVFTLIGQGLDPQSISERLNISPNTVDTHRINIKNKLNKKNSKEVDRAAYEATELGKLPKKK